MCGEVLNESNYYAGRKRKYCSNRCKQKAKWDRWREKNKHFVSNFSVISEQMIDE